MLILFLLCLFLMGTSDSIDACPQDQRLMRVIRQCQKDCALESFVIMKGEQILYRSPLFEDYLKRVLSVCLESTLHNQYTLLMSTSSGLSWRPGSWLELRGEYDNSVFKGTLTDDLVGSFEISLHNLVQKNDEWKLTFGVVVGLWMDLSYVDSAWETVTLGSVSTMVYGTQYFRKRFSGLQSMAAYDLQMYYRYGVIAYINGVEVVRDNMPSGTVSPTTYATGSYVSESYHSFIRPGHEVEYGQNILAVEYHFLKDVPSSICTFNAFLAIHAPSIFNNPCWVLPTRVTISTSDANAIEAFNFNTADGFTSQSLSERLTLQYQLSPTTRALVNGLRIWSSTNLTYMPRSFHLSASTDGKVSTKQILAGDHVRYIPNTFSVFKGYFNTALTSLYHLTITQRASRDLCLYEAQPMVCALQPPTSITFPQGVYSFLTGSPIPPIAPTIVGISGCFVLPPLPTGLSVNADTCTISGTPTSIFAKKVFTVTSHPHLPRTNAHSQFDDGISGTFSLEVKGREGLMVMVTRTYTESPHEEWYTIYDDVQNTVLYREAINDAKSSAHSSHSFDLHAPTIRLRVELGSTSRSWSRGSSLVLSIPFTDESEREVLLRTSYDSILGLPSIHYVSTYYPIERMSEWYYSFGTVYEGWSNWDFHTWNKAIYPEFPVSTNQIQLYKRRFELKDATIATGFVLHLQYKYGVIVYINEVEVYRNHVTGELGDVTFATAEYSTLAYHLVSIPAMVSSSLPEERQEERNGRPSHHRDHNSSIGSSIGSSTGSSIESMGSIVQTGENILAIAVIAMNVTQITPYFDCVLHVLTDDSSRVWDYTVTTSESTEDHGVFDLHHDGFLRDTGIDGGGIEIGFEHGRQEWISGLALYGMHTGVDDAPQTFDVYAFHENEAEWELVKRVEGLQWTQAGQVVFISLFSSTPYSKYKVLFLDQVNNDDDGHENTISSISSFSSSSSNSGHVVHSYQPTKSHLQLNQIDLLTLSVTTNVETLFYRDLTGFRGVPLAPSYPSSTQYTEFEISPSLPAGLSLDYYTGVVQGTPTEETASQQFTITCRHLGNIAVSVTFNLTITTCSGENTLVTIEVMTPHTYGKDRVTLYHTRGDSTTSNTNLLVIDPLPCCSPIITADVCLSPAIYTFQYEEKQSAFMDILIAYRISFTDTSFHVATGYFQERPGHQSSRTALFSTDIPFTMNATQWKLYPEADYPSDWTLQAYDDRFWPLVAPREVEEILQPPTLYFRLPFDLSDMENHSLMNIRVWYIGGLAVYINGHRVAKFRLPDFFSHTTPGLGNYEGTFSVFHVVLGVVEAMMTDNVIAVELHRPTRGHPISFDAVGVYDVETCSVLLDTVTVLEESPGVQGAASLLRGELNPTGEFPSIAGSSMMWQVDNEDGCYFNRYSVVSRNDYTSIAYRLSGISQTIPIHPRSSSSSSSLPSSSSSSSSLSYYDQSWVELDIVAGHALYAASPSVHTTPAGSIAFQTFRWELLQPAWSSHHFLGLQLQYCHYNKQPFCRAVDGYPAVAEGEISAVLCEAGYTGYQYRECHDGVLGKIKSENCHPLPPSNLQYGHQNHLVIVRDVPMEKATPIYDHLITEFYMDNPSSLPSGLSLHPQTGTLSGTPREIVKEKPYRIFGSNPSGVTSAEIFLTVQLGTCREEPPIPAADVGTMIWLDCKDLGQGVGQIMKVCVLGKKDGEWQTIQGVCVSQWVLTVILIGVMLLLIGVGVWGGMRWKYQQVIRRRRSYRFRVASEGNRGNILV